jgi:glucokinase
VTDGVALAIDLGGTKVEAALVDSSGSVLASSRFRAATGKTAASDQLALAVDEVVGLALAALPAEAPLLGVGIGSAGPVDEAEGTVSPCQTARASYCAWTASASPSQNTGSGPRGATRTSWA